MGGEGVGGDRGVEKRGFGARREVEGGRNNKKEECKKKFVDCYDEE